jgi:predicted ATPase/DNA-binding XRE family transcriptional regulator
MEETPSFGYWVRRQRKALDLTRDELAHQVGCAGVTVKKIEMDERRPSLQIAERLADALAIQEGDRATFLRCARGELSPLRLALPAQPVGDLFPEPSRGAALPRPLSSLIGRQQEWARIQALLLEDEVRLVTLTGPGGTGKTRLAVEVASHLQEAFVDGAHFVSLAPIQDPDLVVATICHAFGLAEVAGRSLLDTLKGFLLRKQLLLVLDNFEHLLEAAPVVGDLLEAAPRLKVLVTSRSILHLYGEHEFLVPPLAWANLYRLPPLEDLQKVPAVALFVQRARAAQVDFQLTQENAQSVAELCVQLDGLPLAIELAAARVKLFSPKAMLDRLSEPLRFLTGGPRNLPARHQALSRTIEWSYRLLNKAEQALFRQLAPFAGGASWEAIAAIIAEPFSQPPALQTAISEWKRTSRHPAAVPDQLPSALDLSAPSLLEQIESLLNKSLIHTVEGYKDEPRIGMLDTVRAYALQRLNEAGEEATLYLHHLHYFLHFAETARYHLTSAGVAEWLERLTIDYDNLRVALRWAIANQPVLGLRLAVALAEFWDTRGLVAEGRRWLAASLTKVETSQPPLKHPPALPVVARLELARLAFRAGDLNEQESLAEMAATLARQQGNQELLADALSLKGMAQIYHERYAEGVQTLEEVIAFGRRIHYPVAVHTACQTLGAAFVFQNEPERAIPYLEECLAVTSALGVVRGEGITLALLGFADLERGESAQACQRFIESIKNCAYIRDTLFIVYPLIGMIQIAALHEQARNAAHLIGALDSLLQETAVTLLPVARVRLERAAGKARASLGEALFDTLRAEGQAMSLAQVIAAALAFPI